MHEKQPRWRRHQRRDWRPQSDKWSRTEDPFRGGPYVAKALTRPTFGQMINTIVQARPDGAQSVPMSS
jgi:hypothetical protein